MTIASLIKKAAIWSTHVFLWVLLVAFLNSELLDLEWGYFAQAQGTLLVPLIVGMIANALIFYSQVRYFIPRKFSTNKLSYWGNSLLLCLLISSLVSLFDYLYIDYRSIRDVNVMNIEKYAQLLMFNTIIRFFWWVIALAYRFPIDWIKKERQKEALQKQKLTVELEFLKAQINPHFLFNGINSIYHLIDLDQGKAKNTLLQFSDLLRYQIYECSTEYISLNKELNYLQSYIGMERVRRESDMQICLHIDDELAMLDSPINGGIRIAPLLITPFVENGFKYVSNHENKDDNRVDISFSLQGNKLNFVIINTFGERHVVRKGKDGGLGIANVRKRLELIYPHRHSLVIGEKNNVFEVNLNIEL